MRNRERAMAVLNYRPCDRLPIVHFGFWHETLQKWAAQGHISDELAQSWADGTPADAEISKRLGFDFNWFNCFSPNPELCPTFEPKTLKTHPDGSREVLQHDGTVVLAKDGAGSIPSEIDHTLKDRQTWEEHYLPRLQFSPERILNARVNTGREFLPYNAGGREFLQNPNRENPLGLFSGSLLGRIRNWFGVVGLSYLALDDEPLFDEIIDTVGDLCFRCVEYVLKDGCTFDFGHFWEDICFKNGPLVVPDLFEQKVGPQYKRITDLLSSHGIHIVSLDCDGLIDALVPIWFHNGVNTMFPIEVGTWNASIEPWRRKYGRELRGVGGMRKYTFALDKDAVNDEIERLRPLVDLGGYIPCPDHRISPDAEWDLVRYYCERMREIFHS